MVYVMCPKHGGNGAAAVCQHILNAVSAGERPGPMARLMVEFESHQLGPIWFCAACASQHGISPEGMVLTGESSLDQMFDWGWCPICPLCFRDAGKPGAGSGA